MSSLSENSKCFQGKSWKKSAPDEDVLEFVAINGFCSNIMDPWADTSTCWLEDQLLDEHPKAQVTILNFRLSSLLSWHSIANAADGLCYELSRLNHGNKTNIVAICHGIGGIILLKATCLLRLEPWIVHNIKVSAILFLGTPLALMDNKSFKKTLQSCAAIEIGIDQDLTLEVSDDAVTDVKELLAICGQGKLQSPFISCYETKESLWKVGILGKRRKWVVPKEVATLDDPNGVLCGINASHEGIAKLGPSGYREIKQDLNAMISSIMGQVSRITSSSLIDGRAYNPIPDQSAGQDRPLLPPELTAAVSGYQRLSKTKPQCQVLWYHQRNPHFVGRSSTLDRLGSYLSPDKDFIGVHKQRAYAVWGKGGVGKTQVAIQYVLDHTSTFPYILWAPAESRDKLLTSFSEYALQLGLITQQQQDPREGKDILFKWYATTTAPWLIVFDNADEIGLLPEFWPGGDRGSILITSRDRMSESSTLAGCGERLSEFDEDTAMHLLQSLLGRQLDDLNERNYASSIVARVQYLPLAIKSVVGTIIEAGCSLKEFLDGWTELQDIVADSEIQYINTPTSRYEHSLKTVWASSVRALGATSPSRDLLETLSVLDPDGISEDILKSAPTTASGTSTFLGSKAYLRACRNLQKSSLVDRVQIQDTLPAPAPAFASFQVVQAVSVKDSQLVIHRLIRTYIHGQMDSSRKQKSFSSALSILTHAWPYPAQHNRTQGAFWLAQEKYMPHVRSLASFYHMCLKNDPRQSPKASTEFVKLVNSAAWYCYTRGMYNEGYPLIRTAQQALSLADDGDPAWNMVALQTNNTIASIHTETGEFDKALEEFTLCLSYFHDLVKLGLIRRPDVREAQSIGGIANALSGLGRHAESETRYRESIELWKEDTYPAYRIVIARPMLNQGKVQETSDWLEMVLREREERFGADSTMDYKTGQVYYHLGDVRLAQRRMQEAFELHKKCLQLFKATWGLRHKITGDACFKVATHEARMDDYAAAIKTLEETLNIYQAVSDQNSVRGAKARAMFKLSLCLEKVLGQVSSEVLDWRRKADDLRRQVMGDKYMPGTDEESYKEIVSIWAL